MTNPLIKLAQILGLWFFGLCWMWLFLVFGVTAGLLILIFYLPYAIGEHMWGKDDG